MNVTQRRSPHTDKLLVCSIMMLAGVLAMAWPAPAQELRPGPARAATGPAASATSGPVQPVGGGNDQLIQQLAQLLAGQSKPAAALEPPATGETHWCAIFMGGQKIGHGYHNRTVADKKVTTTEAMQLSLARSGIPLSVTQKDVCVETDDGKPISFSAVQDAQEVEGAVKDGKIAMKIKSGDSTQERSADWPEGAMMAEGLRLLELSKGIKAGTQYTAKVFLPSMSTTLDVDVVIGTTKPVDLLGRVVELTEVKTTLKMSGGAAAGIPGGKIATTDYVDKELVALKTVTSMMGMNIEMVQCSKAFATSPDDVVDFLDKVILASPQPLGNLKAAKSVKYTLKATGSEPLQLPNTDNQSVIKNADGSVTLTVRPAVADKAQPIPYDGKDAAALAALKPARFIQSDDAKVKELAGQAVGQVKDAAEGARKIESFVRGYINKKDLSVGYASAAEVAVSREGDCTEHAVLVAAMCRAAGIPARVCSGLAYVQEFAGKKSVFGPHAWAEAFIGGKWIGLDAALNGFDAGHITITAGDGNIEDFFADLNVLGNCKIEKAEVER